MTSSGPGSHGARVRVRRLHHSGPAPVHVLVVGDRAALGAEGPDATDLPERLIDRVWLRTRRGVDLDVMSDLHAVLRAVGHVFREWRLWRYDAVVLVVDQRLESPLRIPTLERLRRLLARVIADAGSTSPVIVAETAPRADGRRGESAPSRVHRLVDGLEPGRVVFCAAPPHDDGRALAAAVSDDVVAGLTRPDLAGAARRAAEDEEAARQRALDALGIVGADPDPRLDDLVELARTAFGTECAEINFIDHDRQWKMAVAGSVRETTPRAHAFCSYTIQQDEPTIIPDTTLDPRVWDSPLVKGPRPIRFYAAHPIQSLDGYRIGSFCIYDSQPREPEEVNLDVLRDLALLAQAEITGADEPPIGLTARLKAS